MNIVVIFTCFNRKEKTESCIRTLDKGNPNCQFTFVVVDDNSTDGTQKVLQEMKKEFNVHLLKGAGNLFYSGGMRLGMEYALASLSTFFDYMLMINDDVYFYEQCIEKMVLESQERGRSVIVGATCDSRGNLSYSGIKYTKGIKYKKLTLEEHDMKADTFNANCVLVPYEIFREAGSIDKEYIHSLGDFDYGMSLKRSGYDLYITREYIGVCDNNSNKNTWTDTNLSIWERIRKKESIKGAPYRQWFYYLKKNFGLPAAFVYSVTPYIRIVLKK